MNSEGDDRYLARITVLRDGNEALMAEVAVLRGALHVVQEWRMPYQGFSWENGSSGERDHFRDVASRALRFKPQS